MFKMFKKIICKGMKRMVQWRTLVYFVLFADVLLLHMIFAGSQAKPRIVNQNISFVRPKKYTLEIPGQNCSVIYKDLVGLLRVRKNYPPKNNFNSEPPIEVQSTYKTDGRGRWFPVVCQPRQRTVIIIPFRDRDDHLKYFIEHYVKILQRQLLDYTIIVVEQDYTHAFNRGMLFNIGYKEALSLSDGNQAPLCLILHDVDLLLENDRLIYEC
ncbi:unnamed protein product, partial [Owenia fusiformis]